MPDQNSLFDSIMPVNRVKYVKKIFLLNCLTQTGNLKKKKQTVYMIQAVTTKPCTVSLILDQQTDHMTLLVPSSQQHNVTIAEFLCKSILGDFGIFGAALLLPSIFFQRVPRKCKIST